MLLRLSMARVLSLKVKRKNPILKKQRVIRRSLQIKRRKREIALAHLHHLRSQKNKKVLMKIKTKKLKRT